MHKTGDTLQDRYHIERVLGQGGMGGVYLATHQALEAKVAIKEMTLEIGNEEDRVAAVRQFKKEAQILHLLQHENLPRVHDFFEEDGKYYLVMDYIEGRTLQQMISVKPMSEADMHQINRPLCAVLEYLHNYSPPIIFRDLKPSNVMLASDGVLKLIDFGIAKDFDIQTGRGTQTSVRGAGTRGYASPEQYGAGSDVRTDIYALGATLYTLLTQVVPPDSVDIASGGAELQPVLDLRPDVSPNTARVIEWMMAINRTQRPASMREVSVALGYQEQASFTVLPQRVLDQIQVDEDRLNPNVTRNRFQTPDAMQRPVAVMERADPTRIAPPEAPPPSVPIPPPARGPGRAMAVVGLLLAALVALSFLLKTPTITVHLTSDPAGASVVVNQKPFAVTPCDVPDVPTDKMMLVELTLPGYQDYAQQLKVEPQPPTIKLTGAAALVKVWGEPKAELWVDGKLRSEVGPDETSVNLSPGSYTVSLRAAGYLPQSHKLVIPAGGDAPALHYKLLALPVTLAVTGPMDATVSLDGKVKGKIGRDGSLLIRLLPPHPYALHAELTGYVPFGGDVDVKPATANRINIAMTPVAAAPLAPQVPAATVTLAPPSPEATVVLAPSPPPPTSPPAVPSMAPPTDHIVLVAGKSYGDIRLGTPADPVIREYGLQQSAGPGTYLNQTGMFLKVADDNTVLAVGCVPPSVRNADLGGFTMGSPLAEVAKAFPNGHFEDRVMRVGVRTYKTADGAAFGLNKRDQVVSLGVFDPSRDPADLQQQHHRGHSKTPRL